MPFLFASFCRCYCSVTYQAFAVIKSSVMQVDACDVSDVEWQQQQNYKLKQQ